MYFFRDSLRNEVDFIYEKNGDLFAIEIKGAVKMKHELFRGLKFWQENQMKSSCILVYTGSKNEVKNESLSIDPWNKVAYI